MLSLLPILWCAFWAMRGDVRPVRLGQVLRHLDRAGLPIVLPLPELRQPGIHFVQSAKDGLAECAALDGAHQVGADLPFLADDLVPKCHVFGRGP